MLGDDLLLQGDLLIATFGSWLLGQFADAALQRLGEGLFGSEQKRALSAAGEAAIGRTARQLRPSGSDEDVGHLAAIMNQVFQARMSTAPLEDQPTILQVLQTGVTDQLALLDDASLTGTDQSSAQALGIPIERITETLIRNLLQEILARGVGGGPLAPLADQLNHDLSYLQGQHTVGMLARILEELASLGRPRALTHPGPRELPRPIADFTGRSHELVTLRRLLTFGAGESGTPPVEAGRPVVISAIDGMGGIGKSALAIQVAHELVDAGMFPDGQLYVNLQGASPGLAPLDPSDALGRMLRALGLEPAQIPAETEEAAARFRSLAAERRLLILLDNAASPDQVRPLLPASPTCAVLVTSRHVLATLEGTRPLHLDVLPHDQAQELLGRIAGQERIAAAPEAAAAVVRHCGYLPLAIRIAGARLAARPGWAVPVLAARLADATHRLEELQAGQFAVRASFDVSLQALEESLDPLDEAAATAFGLLSLPHGPDLGLAAAARLLHQPEQSAQRVLERLVDAQLLETPRPDRYQFHDLVRLYARQRGVSLHPEPERLAALTRLFRFYTATAWHTLTRVRPGDQRATTADPRWTEGGLHFPDATAALTWLEAERGNLLAAIQQAAAAAPAIPAQLACQLLQALFRFFEVRGYWHDGVQSNQTALELARRTQDLAAQAYALNDLGTFYDRLGRCPDAIACYQESLTIRRQLSDWIGEAGSLSNLGIAYERLGRYAEAITCHQDSLAIFRELSGRHGEGNSLHNLGVVYWRLGRYAEAITCQQDSLTIYRELTDRHGEGNSLTDLGVIYFQQERHDEAIACHQDSLTIYRDLGDRPGEAYSLNNLGNAYRRLGRYAEAITCHQDSLTIYRELGGRHGEADSLNSLGNVYRRLGRYAEAITCHQDSLTIYRELDDRHGEAETLRDLGDALRAVGHDQQAGAAWHEALAICQELQIPDADTIRDRLATLSPELAERSDIE
jgi:tetratricopeptide (TPR) repeat protein